MTMSNEQRRLLHDIGVIGFVVVEMNEYLDTHPTDREAMDYLAHYVRMKNQSMREYARKYGPLRISDTEGCSDKEWKWATQPWPWEGGC
ncbi:MAG: spore coat protein CotJB [Clostridium sp.]|nr:spore coat protein CotJB [Clostridium sp.]